MFDLHGKTALITGSSRGIGRSMALALAAQGARVIIHGHQRGAAAQATAEALAQQGASFGEVYADLSQPDGADVLCAQLEQQGMTVDILILNASIELRREWTDITDAEYDLQMNTNLRSPLKLMQRLIPPMRERGWGRVITVGSVQQKKPHEAMLVYSASKMALCNMMLSLATQLAPDGITLNNIAPGAIRTDRNAEALSDPAYNAHVESLIPVRYIGVPDDIAGLAVYLASEESRYMTGQDLYIDGGKSL